MEFISEILKLPPITIQTWGYLILLGATLFEAFPLFGIFIPGQSLVVISGILAKMNLLNLPILILIIAVGAILGDTFAYILGRKYGHDFLLKYGKYFLLKPIRLQKAQELLDKNVGKTLIIGRLNSFTRAAVPLVTGASQINFKKFFTFNAIGGIIWASTFVGIGYIFGTSYEIVVKYLGQFIFFAIAGTIFLIGGYKFVAKRKQVFGQYHLYALSICITSLWVFLEMAEEIYSKTHIIHLDKWMNELITTIWSPALTQIAIFITNIGDVLNLTVLSMSLLVSLLITKKKYNAILLLFSMIGGAIANAFIKELTERARPLNSLITAEGFSFPSGHSMMSIIFFSLLIYSFKDDIKKPLLKNLFIFGNISIFLLIGMSRIYLNVHWVSDVIAGFALGLFWLTLLILIFKATIFFVRSYKNRLTRLENEHAK
ncbi:MAG: bifunctional DedA family/phosphatase PAP2 family protein [Candidatus Gracilibacteria bacterium]|nr:bifunctional DedA family/phosphatase PAP2 family protein [Candidatus Gracilibacteria bacterium]